MVNYDVFARHYDFVMGDRRGSSIILRNIIQKYNPYATSLLELGCGTGSVLQHFAKEYEIHGLDLSSAMLQHAKKRIPAGHFYHQNMTRFKIAKKFGVIYCVFDSINHLLTFSEWKHVFQKVHAHLENGGIFIFDINTQKKLHTITKNPPRVRMYGKDCLIMEVTKSSPAITNWNTKYFEHQTKSRYHLYEDNAKETSFPIIKIKSGLKQFHKIWVFDNKMGKQPSIASQRLVFVCSK